MPQCTVCKSLFHPDWMVVVDTDNIGKDICKCVFCHTLKDEVSIQDKGGRMTGRVSKKEATENYIKYLKELSEDIDISRLLVTQGNSKR